MDASAWIAQQRITVMRLFSVAGAVIMAESVMGIRRAGTTYPPKWLANWPPFQENGFGTQELSSEVG
jgi:hypothetical protein